MLKAALIKVESSGFYYCEDLKMFLLAISKVRFKSTPPLSKVSESAPVWWLVWMSHCQMKAVMLRYSVLPQINYILSILTGLLWDWILSSYTVYSTNVNDSIFGFVFQKTVDKSIKF